jgi:rod shape-determining protein MreD
MSNFLFLMFFGLFCIVIQSNLFLHNSVLPFRLDLTIPLTLYVGLSQKPTQGCLLVFWFGFLLDVFSGSVMGMYTFLRVFMFLLIHILRKGLFLENRVLFGLLVLALFFLESFLVSLLFGFAGSQFFPWKKLLTFGLIHGLFVLVVWYITYPYFTRLEAFFRKS